MNFVRDWLATDDLSRYPYTLAAGALHVRRPGGEHVAVCVGGRISYRDRAGDWQPLDTALRPAGDGAYGAPGLPLRVTPDGGVRLGSYWQQTAGVALATRSGLRPWATFGAGQVAGDSLIREGPGCRLVTRVTAQGVSETLHLDRRVAGEPGDRLVLVTRAGGRLPAPFRFRAPEAWLNGRRVALAGGGLPVVAARAGAVLDPDFADMTADGYTYGEALTAAEVRSTAYGYGVSGGWIEVGTQWSDGTYRLWRAYLKFDTRSLPTYVYVDDVRVKLTCSSDASTYNFDVNLVKANWSGTDPITSGNKTTAHQTVRDAVLDGLWRNTSGMSVDTQYTSAALDQARIAKGGYTYYGLRSGYDPGGGGGFEGNTMIQLYSQEDGTAGKVPLLAVTYRMAYPRALLGVGR